MQKKPREASTESLLVLKPDYLLPRMIPEPYRNLCGAEYLKVSAEGGELNLYRPGYKKWTFSEVIDSIQELNANI